MPTFLCRNGVIRSHADPHATALLVQGGIVSWLGADADAPSAQRTIDLDGGLVTPAFVDAHVHATSTGLALQGLDLSAAKSAAGVLEAVAAHAAVLPADAMVLGHGFDESLWGQQQHPPSNKQLDRAGAGRSVYLSQASVHSALVSSDLLERARGTAGYDTSGWVRREAHHAVREAAFSRITAAQRSAAQEAMLRQAASLGIAAVHECGGPGISGEADFAALLAKSGSSAPEVYGYWGELSAAAKARELGAVGAGGDLFADGALGAGTASLRAAYADRPGCGHGYLTAEQVAAHLIDCQRHDLQGGFHAIGDAALHTVTAGFALAAGAVGVEALRAARHRVEHAELADRELIADFIEYGIVASMQPAFDRLWGGEDQMYAQRLGAERSLASNPMGQMHATGVALAFGSDTPVTPLDPWGSVRAAAQHWNPGQRMSVAAAFAAHTRGGWRAVHRDAEGVLEPGAAATLAIWRAPAGLAGTLPRLEPGDELPTCVRTVLRGRTIYEEE